MIDFREVGGMLTGVEFDQGGKERRMISSFILG